MSFPSFGLAEPILRAVVAEGYTTPTPIQAEAIPQIIAGRDVLGCAQTGTGKTAAFALPILHRLIADGNPPRGAGRHIRTLILAPTRELAAQIHDSFRSYGRHTALRHVVIYGGVGQHPQVKALRNGVDVVIATPGRLVDLMNQGHVDLRHVEYFVLDEADRMLDMGFLPDLRRIMAKLPTKRQTTFFSATMPPPIEQLANASLRDPARIRIAPQQVTTDQIDESICFVSQAQKTDLLIEMLKTRNVERTLVFTRTKHGADRVAKQLSRAGIPAEAMHGNKSQAARQRTLAAFKSKKPPVVVATDLASRGIDVTAVSHVFNYDLPMEPETYVHRIGRTGRAGATGVAVSFCDHAERGMFKSIERLLRRTLRVDPIGGSRPPVVAEKSHENAPRGNGHGKQGRFKRQISTGGRAIGSSRGGRPGKRRNVPAAV